MPVSDATHDLVIIGGGPGGYAAALYGAGQGLDVGMIEMAKVGGTCLHVGCIPAKEFLETATVHRTVAQAKEFGVETSPPTLDFGVSQDRKQEVVDKLFKGLSGLLKQRQVTIYDGVGTLHAGRQVRVTGGASGDVTLDAGAVVLASGSAPRTLPGFDVDGEIVLTSDEFLSLRELPARAAVIGGGAIGCEFASTMADLGTRVTVLEALPQILPGCDDDCARVVTRSFKKRGIEVRTGVAVTGHEPGGDGTVVHFGKGEELAVEKVIMAIGRRPLSETLGLEGTAVGVDERGFVEVDAACRTAEAGVFAVGDVIATPALAHVGFAEAIVVVDQLLGRATVPVDYARVPWCIYCHPEVAFAGYSEQAATEAGFDVVTAKHRMGGNGRALIVGEPDGLVKVIAEKNADGSAGQILGVHMVGPWVTEQLGAGYLAVNWEARPSDVAAFIQPHPTIAETFGDAVMALAGRSIH